MTQYAGYLNFVNDSQNRKYYSYASLTHKVNSNVISCSLLGYNLFLTDKLQDLYFCLHADIE